MCRIGGGLTKTVGRRGEGRRGKGCRGRGRSRSAPSRRSRFIDQARTAARSPASVGLSLFARGGLRETRSAGWARRKGSGERARASVRLSRCLVPTRWRRDPDDCAAGARQPLGSGASRKPAHAGGVCCCCWWAGRWTRRARWPLPVPSSVLSQQPAGGNRMGAGRSRGSAKHARATRANRWRPRCRTPS